VFVAVLGASSYTFAEATAGQDLRNWIGSHQRTFEFFGGTVEVVVPDNLKSAVTHPSYYEPDLNPTYRDLGEHYALASLAGASSRLGGFGALTNTVAARRGRIPTAAGARRSGDSLGEGRCGNED
jgi:transposase